MFKKSLIMFLFLLLPTGYLLADANVDKDRQEEIQKWKKSGIGDVSAILSETEAVLNNESSSRNKLLEAAGKANSAANYVTYLQEEYADAYRENSRYDWITDKIVPGHDAYVGKANALKDIRNEIYIRLGDMSYENGDKLEAFMYYRDAYRLSTFRGQGIDGARYRAEQKMKEILGLTEVESYSG